MNVAHTNQVFIRRPGNNRWLRFANPVAILKARRWEDVLPVLKEIDEIVAEQNKCAAGFIGYEAAPGLDPSLSVRRDHDLPLVWFGIYDLPESVPLPRSSSWVEPGNWIPSIGRQDYRHSIGRIKELIARGDTYQVNYTFRLRTELNFDPCQFFLKRARRAGYSAYLDIGRFAIASLSPELFFRLKGEEIISRPMKGTAGRQPDRPEDIRRAVWLRNSEKNRAENLMIVDMIRNDLGKIAETGSVKVDRLFQIEPHPDVWQMTSTVSARTRALFSEIMTALFPCASVTGAPKPRTMEIIAALESSPRRIYCGAIGYILPGRRARFSVAIRTLLADREEKTAEYGVGGGIVWKSDPEDEYRECLLKGRAATGTIPDFALLETILWRPEIGFFLLSLHLRRLRRSAEFFGFWIDMKAIIETLREAETGFPPRPNKIRLLLSCDGNVEWDLFPIHSDSLNKIVRLKPARHPIDSGDSFLYHKTTNRWIYDSARNAVKDCDDVLLYNQSGEVTETSIANILVKTGGRLLTPPVSSGLLAGTYREKLLREGRCRESIVKLEELKAAEAVYTVNSVRGIKKAEILYD